MTVFQSSKSHQPPRQVNGVVIRLTTAGVRLVMRGSNEHKSSAMLLVELGNGVVFVWRPEMRCLVPADKEKELKDLQPGDHVLFNNAPQTIASIHVYG